MNNTQPINNNPQAVEYSILNFKNVQNDVMARSRIILEYRNLIDRRIKIEFEYVNKVKDFMTNLETKLINNPTKQSEIYMNCLINSFKSQSENLNNYKTRLTTEVQGLIKVKLIQFDIQAKKNISNGLILQQQIQSHHQNMERVRIKYFKKCNQLRKQKQEYVVGYLTDMTFEKKNKLYLRIREEENALHPLHKQFCKQVQIYNQHAQIYAQKMNQTMQKTSENEQQRLKTLRNSFMILQIAKSQYGASMVTQNNVLLMKLNQYAGYYPDFKKQTSQKFKENKKSIHIELSDPNKYINTLFNHIDQKLTENLIIYGSSAQEKEKLDSSLIGEISHIDNQQNSQQQNSYKKDQLQRMQSIIICFKNIFDEKEQLESAKVIQLQILMENSFQGRKQFILCLQRFRWIGKFEVSSAKIIEITQIMNVFLDQCFREKDTYNSKLLMILSLTYHIKINGQKIQLHQYIKTHKIWKDKDWWECAILETIFEQTKIKKKIQDNYPISIWDIKGSGLKQNMSEHQVTYQHAVFNQLAYYITNMRLFKLEKQNIVHVIRKCIKYFCLSGEMVEDLETCLNTDPQQSFIDITNGVKTECSNLKKSSKKILFG